MARAARFDSCLCGYVYRGPLLWVCVECERACVCGLFKWVFGVYARVHLSKGLDGGLIWVRVCVSACAYPRVCLERVCPNV